MQPGETHSTWEQMVNGITYHMNDNPMGITKFKVTFDGDKGCFAYTNAQGDKELCFGLGWNEFGEFPQEGYSAEIGSQYAPGHKTAEDFLEEYQGYGMGRMSDSGIDFGSMKTIE